MIQWIGMTWMGHTEHPTLISLRFSSLWEKWFILQCCESFRIRIIIIIMGNAKRLFSVHSEICLGFHLHFWDMKIFRRMDPFQLFDPLFHWALNDRGKKGPKNWAIFLTSVSHFYFIHAKKYYYFDCVWKVNIKNHQTLQP